MSAPVWSPAVLARRARIEALRSEERSLALEVDLPLADGGGVLRQDTAMGMADDEEIDEALQRLDEVRRELAAEEYLIGHPELPLVGGGP